VTAPFPRYVARRLGMDPALAAQLLGVMRHRLGTRRFAVRACAFALATCGPPARILPARLRRPAIVGLVRPLLADPPPRLAYLLAQPAATPCGGLLPPS
jgi:hypothetical protein